MGGFFDALRQREYEWNKEACGIYNNSYAENFEEPVIEETWAHRAQLFTENLSSPIDDETLKEIHTKLVNGTDINSLLEVGWDRLFNIYIFTAATALLALVLLIFGRQSLGKPAKKSENNGLTLIPWLLLAIPVIVTTFALLCTSVFFVWESNSQLNSQNLTEFTKEEIKFNATWVMEQGDCEVKNHLSDLEHTNNISMQTFAIHVVKDCDAFSTFSSRWFSMRSSLNYLWKSGETVKEFLEQIEKGNLDLNVSSELNSSLNSAAEEIKKMQDFLFKQRDYENKLGNIALEKRNNLKNMISMLSPKSLGQKVKNRFSTFVKKTDEAYKVVGDWVNIVITRVNEIVKLEKRNHPTRVSFTILQFVVALSSLLAILYLVICSVLSLLLLINPNLSTKHASFLTVFLKNRQGMFFTSCLAAIGVACISGITLREATSMNTMCSSLFEKNDIHNNTQRFYETFFNPLAFNNFDGDEITTNLHDVIFVNYSNYFDFNALVHSDGGYEQLLDEYAKEFNVAITEALKIIPYNMDDGAFIRGNKYLNISLPSFYNSLIYDDLTYNITLFLSNLRTMEFFPGDITLNPCPTLEFLHTNDNLKEGKGFVFGLLVRTVDKFKSRLDELYYFYGFQVRYKQAGLKLCNSWRTPLAGAWISEVLLSLCLILCSIITLRMCNIIRRLHCKNEEKFPEANNGEGVSLFSGQALTLEDDEKKMENRIQ